MKPLFQYRLAPVAAGSILSPLLHTRLPCPRCRCLSFIITTLIIHPQHSPRQQAPHRVPAHNIQSDEDAIPHSRYSWHNIRQPHPSRSSRWMPVTLAGQRRPRTIATAHLQVTTLFNGQDKRSVQWSSCHRLSQAMPSHPRITLVTLMVPGSACTGDAYLWPHHLNHSSRHPHRLITWGRRHLEL